MVLSETNTKDNRTLAGAALGGRNLGGGAGGPQIEKNASDRQNQTRTRADAHSTRIEAVRPALARAKGLIINQSSMASYIPASAYGLTKATLNAFTFSATNATDFPIPSNGCTGASLTQGASCTISVSFDPSTATATRFRVMWKDKKWVIPSHYDYPADARDRLSKTAAAVTDLTKDTIRSDDVKDQEAMGVIDPLDAKTTTLQGRGKRVTPGEMGTGGGGDAESAGKSCAVIAFNSPLKS